MNRIGFLWDIKTTNIEYYDIQYAAERTIYYNHDTYSVSTLRMKIVHVQIWQFWVWMEKNYVFNGAFSWFYDLIELDSFFKRTLKMSRSIEVFSHPDQIEMWIIRYTDMYKNNRIGPILGLKNYLSVWGPMGSLTKFGPLFTLWATVSPSLNYNLFMGDGRAGRGVKHLKKIDDVFFERLLKFW